MNLPGVKKALNAPEDVEWTGCMPGAGRRRHLASTLLIHDQPVSTLPYIADLLDAGKRVLMYNGDRDLSTCIQGTEELLNNMKWTGADQWPTVKRGLWVVDGEVPAGYSKSHRGLDFVVIYNSGHLVPFNQPRNALDLFTRFLENRTFSDHNLPDFDYGFKRSSPPTSRHRHHTSHSHHDATSHSPSPGNQDGQSSFGFMTLALVAMLSFAVGAFGSKTMAARSGYRSIPDSDAKGLVLQ